MDGIVSIIPIALLIFAMTRRNPIPSNKALPLAATGLYLIQLTYFARDPNLIHAAVLEGALASLTPVLIVAGAVFLFRTMERSGAMDVIRGKLNQMTSNKAGQVMIIGWSFSFLIEGASGFGTPAALAAPLLVALGFPPLGSVVLCLIMNSVPVSFGAMGMPTWFGFGELGLKTEELRAIGFRTALLHAGAALIIPVIALRVLLDLKTILENIWFIYASVFASCIPYLALAYWNYEFPTLVGGAIGLVVTVLLARRRFGLKGAKEQPNFTVGGSVGSFARALFPLWGTLLLLLVTRSRYLGLKDWLTSSTPAIELPLGSLGVLSVSSALVVQLKGIFQTDYFWTHPFLYVPSIFPFLAISILTYFLMRKERGGTYTPWHQIKATFKETWSSMRKPLGAFIGALVLVKLFMVGGETSSASVLGKAMAAQVGGAWLYVSPLLGALGAFFSGSNTISNLTFGGIQNAAAISLGLDRTMVLALQSAGGAMGNMICIHNIVAASAVVGLKNQEGAILRQTAIPMVAYATILIIFAFVWAR